MADYFSVLPSELRHLLKFYVNYTIWKLFNDILLLCRFQLKSYNKTYFYEELQNYEIFHKSFFKKHDIKYDSHVDYFTILPGEFISKSIIFDYLRQSEIYEKYSPIRFKINNLLQGAGYINLQNHVSFYRYHV